MTFAETKTAIRKNHERGIFGPEVDHDALAERLDACTTVAELDAWKRMTFRWEWATELPPDHLTFEDAMRMSAA